MESIFDAVRTSLRSQLVESFGIDLGYPERVERDLQRALGTTILPAAVVLLFGVSADGQEHLLYIRRAETVETHKGQMAFPGGMCDPEDEGSLARTALRETHEELGIPAEKIELLGELPHLHTITGFRVSPQVGVLQVPIEEVQFTLSEEEIAEVFWISLQKLKEPGVYRRETLHAKEKDYYIDVYQVEGRRIWGATGSMTKNLLERLKKLESEPRD